MLKEKRHVNNVRMGLAVFDVMHTEMTIEEILLTTDSLWQLFMLNIGPRIFGEAVVSAAML